MLHWLCHRSTQYLTNNCGGRTCFFKQSVRDCPREVYKRELLVLTCTLHVSQIIALVLTETEAITHVTH